MSESIFDGVLRGDPSPRAYSESSAHFLNRVHGAYWNQVRDLVDAWVSHLPTSARMDIVGRLVSPDDRHSGAAFWELYLHETLTRAGFDVTIHPAVLGSPRPPDFLARSESVSFYLEAKTVYGTESNRGAGARKEQLYDAINLVHSPNFSVAIDVLRIGDRTPPAGSLRTEIETWLADLDPDYVQASLTSEGPDDVHRWQKDGWDILFRPLPIRAELRGAPDHRLLGILGGTGERWTDDAAVLREAIRTKGSAYGKLDLPLLIALNLASTFHNESDTINALYGTEQLNVRFDDPEESAHLTRALDGYWGYPNRGKHRHVSGVVLGLNVAPWRVATTWPTLWQHPDPITSVSALAEWESAPLVVDHIEHILPAKPIHCLFELAEGWPTGEPFPRRGWSRD